MKFSELEDLEPNERRAVVETLLSEIQLPVGERIAVIDQQLAQMEQRYGMTTDEFWQLLQNKAIEGNTTDAHEWLQLIARRDLLADSLKEQNEAQLL